MCDAIDGGIPPLPKAAMPAATGECRIESTSIAEGSIFSKYFGSMGFTIEWATAATP